MDPKQLTERIHQATPFIKLLGIEVVRAEGDGYVEMRMPINEEYTQNLGHAHGGAIGTLADFAANLAIKERTVTVEYKINFLAPAKGDELFAEARVIRQGAKITTAQSDIYAVKEGERTLVATCLATLIASRKK